MSHLYNLYNPGNSVPMDNFVPCLGFMWPYNAEYILLFKQIFVAFVLIQCKKQLQPSVLWTTEDTDHYPEYSNKSGCADKTTLWIQ